MAIHPSEPGSSRPLEPAESERLPAGEIPRTLTRSAFADLLEASSETLWTIAAAILGDPGEAEDVLQEAAIAALDKLERFQPGTSFLAWMASFVRNHARNHARKRQRRATRPTGRAALEALEQEVDRRSGRRVPRPEEVLHAGLGLGPGGALPADSEAFDDRVLAALARLADEQRAAFLLRVVNDLSYREIGQALGLPEGTAASHIHRARAQVRAFLTESSEEGTPEAPDGKQPLREEGTS